MILKKKIEDAGLKIEVVENYTKPNTFDKKIKIEYLIFNLDNIHFELTASKYNKNIATFYVLTSNWKIIFSCYDFQKVVSFLENIDHLVKLAKDKVC